VIGGQVAESAERAVGPVFLRHDTKAGHRASCRFSAAREAFPTKNRRNVSPAAVGPDEVIKQVRERIGLRHTPSRRMGESDWPMYPASGVWRRLMSAFGTVQSRPLPHRRSSDAGIRSSGTQ